MQLEGCNGKWEAGGCCDMLLKTLIGLLITTCSNSGESYNFLKNRKDINRK